MPGKFYTYKGFRIWKYDDEPGTVRRDAEYNKYFEEKKQKMEEAIRLRKLFGR